MACMTSERLHQSVSVCLSSQNYYYYSVSFHVLPFLCMTAFLTCCSHLDLDLPPGNLPINLMFRTFGIYLHSFLERVHTTSFCYSLVCLPRCLTLDSPYFFVSYSVSFGFSFYTSSKCHLYCHFSKDPRLCLHCFKSFC
jgi:hypothetical protein